MTASELVVGGGRVVVYCRSGLRSSAATQLLRAHGFTKIHDLGPMTAW